MLTVEGADAESRGDRDTPLRVRDMDSETPDYYDILRQVHHSMLLQCLGWRKRQRDDHILSHADAFATKASGSIEATVRHRKISFAGFVARMAEERLPQGVMFGELVGGKVCSGEQEKDWMVRLEEDMTQCDMKLERWRKAAQKAGRRWFRRVEEGAEASKWHHVQN